MLTKTTARILCVIFLLVADAALAETHLASWNLKRFSSSSEKDVSSIARVAGNFDIIAVQEVLDEDAVNLLENQLERQTGERWNSLHSHLIGRGTYKELYAFLWKEKSIQYVDGAVVYLDSRDVFAREPFSARFRSKKDNQDFILSTVHILYGKSKEDRIPEIQALKGYWEWMTDIYSTTPLIFLTGDFNMPPSDKAWSKLMVNAKPLLTRGASTLRKKDGEFLNLYDNIWVPKSLNSAIKRSNIVNFPQILGISHSESHRLISDHAPVFVTFESVQTSQIGSIKFKASTIKTPNKEHAPIVASKRSLIYHRPDCPNYGRISSINRIEFNSINEAEKEGYRAAYNCPKQ